MSDKSSNLAKYERKRGKYLKDYYEDYDIEQDKSLSRSLIDNSVNSKLECKSDQGAGISSESEK